MNQALETLADVLIRILVREAAEADSVSSADVAIRPPERLEPARKAAQR